MRIEVLDEMSAGGGGSGGGSGITGGGGSSSSSSSNSSSAESISSSASSNLVGGLSSSEEGGGQDHHGGGRHGVGTALYAPPEQLSWSGGKAPGMQGGGGGVGAGVHAAADIYSLGVTICEVVAGFYTASERMLALLALTGRGRGGGGGASSPPPKEGGCAGSGRLPRGFAPPIPALGAHGRECPPPPS
jgi:hypothetical protein